jgi:hypothetical protein
MPYASDCVTELTYIRYTSAMTPKQAQAEKLLNWLLKLPDPGPLPPLGSQGLMDVRKELFAECWGPVSLESLQDGDIERTYRDLCTTAQKLRTGIPIVLSGYLIQLPRGARLKLQSQRREQHKVVLLSILLREDLLRRCKHCGKAFVRHRKQEYCSKQCSGLARIRKYRAKWDT